MISSISLLGSEHAWDFLGPCSPLKAAYFCCQFENVRETVNCLLCQSFCPLRALRFRRTDTSWKEQPTTKAGEQHELVGQTFISEDVDFT